MTIEQTIGQCILGQITQDVAFARVTCNAVASQQIFCHCGKVLDQKTIVVVTVETPKRKVVQGFCPTCWEAKKQDILHAAKVTETPLLIETWE